MDPETSAASADARAAADFIRARTGGAAPPRVALVLGTGLGALAERVTHATVVPYAEIPRFPRATVAGHAGRLVLGELQGVPVAALQGRFHLYEGYSPHQVVLPVRALRLLGAETLIVTNAAGGINPALGAGDLMLLADHIGLVTMAGLNPLSGPNDEGLGPRFPALTDAYDGDLRVHARTAAAALAIPLHEGVYAMVAGPSYETPAELRFLRTIGADAVGMSTVPEVIAARHAGMRVLGVSCITNVTLPADDSAPIPQAGHAEVLANAERGGVNLAALIERVLAAWRGEGNQARP